MSGGAQHYTEPRPGTARISWLDPVGNHGCGHWWDTDFARQIAKIYKGELPERRVWVREAGCETGPVEVTIDSEGRLCL